MGLTAFEPIKDIVSVQWCEVLGTASACLEDNFFAQGGDSYMALNLKARLEQSLKVEFPLDVLYIDGTLQAVVDACTTAAG